MSALWPWIVGLIAVIAIWVDIPKHQIDFPFGCPGICLRIGDRFYNQEIKTHLGLDLQGGTQLILQLRTDQLPPGVTTPLSTLNEQVRETIDRRINALGVAEPLIQAAGDDKVLLELPGVSDLERAQELATQQAFLEIKVPVDETTNTEFKSLEPPLTGANLKPTFVTFEGQGQGAPVVNFEFGGADGDRWVKLSQDYLERPVQITLDGREISAPVIQEVFSSGSGVIRGRFTTAEAKELSLLLNSGALPVPLEVIQSTRIEPTLGAESVRQSLVAGAIGLGLVALFMISYYRVPGILAVIALLYYTALTYAIFRLIPVTLTLAGIAGFILSIGMAVDANVLTFERLKEELRTGKSLRAAVEEGRKRAFPSIAYSNAATIITSAILFYFGTGSVKGFALTLGIGVAVSFFTAVVVTQMLLRGVIEIPRLRTRALFGVEERATDARRAEPRPAGA
ncbi:MAG: protein-export membrane protein SecD [Chloroflexi bacterium RIFCSPLOWO2_12_FULL_71_12]|nr:MAG: protein-export membrane protein SecD [Chloroflexi bacterium GWC2_70_10]OGO69371.1 MAG: protein-export membrane protein SecD [Chloroflexi bacterium RIFCSPLOWO2_02_FULL_71_16]OGO74302.1 MAG: protein-export membrane protein SecD [Chloroflexi bacterium RIFCSPLOWO2_12_FULL_71_12]